MKFRIKENKKINNLSPYLKKVINSEKFKEWFGDWEKYPQYASKVVDENNIPKIVYHGLSRPDRVNCIFSPKRAVAGPMPYFTDNPEIASSYSNKTDLSLTGENKNYENWFLIKIKGYRNPKSISDLWYYLSSEEKDNIKNIAPYITRDDNGNIYISKESGLKPLNSFNYDVNHYRGNYISALIETWLNSGELFDDEYEFIKVLNLIGIKNVIYNDPDNSYPAVYATFLCIRTPLYHDAIPDNVIETLIKVGKRKKAKEFPNGQNWNKNFVNPKVWLNDLLDSINNPDESFVWTCIPDWVTTTLKQLGYDGIIDRGGKNSDFKHTVYIPFYSNQIKSLWNKGDWNSMSNKINEQILKEYALMYDKEHKDKQGNLKPWIIIDYETNTLLYSYSNKKDAMKVFKHIKYRKE